MSLAKNYFIGIEGISFSGKTTLLRGLLDFFIRQNVIEEYCEYAGGNKNFRTVPFKNEQDAKDNILDFVAWEKRRYKDAAAMKTHGGPIFFDRTFFSVISLQKTLRDCYPSLPNAYDFALETFSNLVNNNEISLPDKMIYIRPDDEKTFLERSTRGVSVSFFSKKETFHYLDAYYKKMLDVFYPENHLVLYSRNGKLNKNKLLLRALRFGYTAQKSPNVGHDIREKFSLLR